MHIEHHRFFSSALGHDMDFKVYGNYGQPILIFPAQDGRFYDYENFGMVSACAGLLEAGRIKFVCADSVDWQTWTNSSAHPSERARRHADYERYIMDELVPWVRGQTGLETLWVSGCSMGALHSANFFFKRPDVFDGVIALSGLYSVNLFVGNYGDDNTYFNSPLQYLPGLNDEWHLDLYRRAKIVFGVGQGSWEEEAIADTRALQALLETKNVPAWFDYWGHDVAHDWVWWRQMMPYFLERML
jgi:esterase/lipase superfamily enzyme